MFVWDEKKREANFIKHRLDFADAALVYENPGKMTFRSDRNGETRYADIAIVRTLGTCLTLAYVHRGQDIRVISFRSSSRRERKLLSRSGQPN